MLCPAVLHPAVSPARRQSRQRRTVAAPVVASGFLPPLVPNPWPAGRRPDTLVELLHVHGKKWSLVKPAEGANDSHGNHLTTGGGPRLRRHVACGDKGHALLNGLQQELYVPGEQGCRVHRESQAKFSLVCEGVTALLNESHSDIVIEVPVPKDESDAKGYHTADDLMNRLDARVHAVLKHS